MSATRSKRHEPTIAEQLEGKKEDVEQILAAIEAELAKARAILETIA